MEIMQLKKFKGHYRKNMHFYAGLIDTLESLEKGEYLSSKSSCSLLLIQTIEGLKKRGLERNLKGQTMHDSAADFGFRIILPTEKYGGMGPTCHYFPKEYFKYYSNKNLKQPELRIFRRFGSPQD
jgi:hypothetical protein